MRMLAVAGLLLWVVTSAWHCGFGTDAAGLSPDPNGMAANRRATLRDSGVSPGASVKTGARIDDNGVASNQQGEGGDAGLSPDPNG